MFKSCNLCNKKMLKKAGDVAITGIHDGIPYEEIKPICRNCYKMIQNEYDIQQLRYDDSED